MSRRKKKLPKNKKTKDDDGERRHERSDSTWDELQGTVYYNKKLKMMNELNDQ